MEKKIKMKIEKGQIYRHFKGRKVEIIDIAVHSENLEELVLYKHLEEENATIWARPITMWDEYVEKEKCPNGKEQRRFELIKPLEK